MPSATHHSMDQPATSTARRTAVAVNGRFLSRRITGVERYAREVCARFGDRVRLIQPIAGRGVVGHVWEQGVLPARIGTRELLWSPANTGPIAVARQVATLHDVSVLDHPEWFDRRFAAWYQWLLPRLARRVRRIITDSAFSRDRIVDTIGISRERVVIVPCGVDRARFTLLPPDLVAATLARHGLLNPYVLAVGSLEPRKNLDILFRAWPRVQRARPSLELVIVGDCYQSFRRSPVRAVLPFARVIRSASDADLPALYCGARAFVVPSLYEGFGLPALEAMACGIPVVSSEAASLPEVVGDAALIVNPRDEQAIADAIVRVLDDEGVRGGLIRRGLERARQFTWDRTAASVWKVLLEAAAD